MNAAIPQGEGRDQAFGGSIPANRESRCDFSHLSFRSGIDRPWQGIYGLKATSSMWSGLMRRDRRGRDFGSRKPEVP